MSFLTWLSEALAFPFGFKTINPRPLDARYGPFPTLADAKAANPQGIRFDGLTVKITGSGEYWWLAADLSDAGLVAKAPAPSGPAYDDTALSNRVTTVEGAVGTNTSSISTLNAAVATPKMATPAFASTLVVNAGPALAKTLEPIIATGDLSLSATLVDGAIISIPVTASGANRAVTVPAGYVAFKPGTLRTKTIDAGMTCRVIIERLGDVYSFGFLG
ncbi:hypothetical protein [Hymenobacter sp. B81]|uniref:hypothetical protein n=1 Tax=Hymenobacter sp. B81 TaxID=3344878 RepID=UPI0037DD91AC